MFQKGHNGFPQSRAQRKEKIAKFKIYIAKELHLDPDSLIVDHLAAMMLSKDHKDRTKVVELILRNLEPAPGEPKAISPEVLEVLAEFNDKRRKKVEGET